MRRGLIARSKTELPDAVFDARLERLRAAMRELDALLVYTNNTRPAAVSWLTGFIPYWSEAMLVVPRNALPVLVVALTFRVKPWIERTSRVAEVIHAPRIGPAAGDQARGLDSDARSVDHLGDAARPLDPRFDAKRESYDENGQSVARNHQHGFRPVRDKAGEPRHRGRTGVVGVDQERVEPPHRRAQPFKPRIEYGIRQLGLAACNQSAAHD